MSGAWAHRLGRPDGRSGRVTVLDIGSSELRCYVAQPSHGSHYELVGAGHHAALGLRGGEVVDSEAVTASLLAAIHEAEVAAGETLREIVLGVNAGCPRTVRHSVDFNLNGRAVEDADLRWLLEHVRAEAQVEGRTTLHTLPVAIAIDDGRPLRDPRGMAGTRLALDAALVHAAAAPLSNLVACVERCHVDVDRIVAAPYASALAVLTADEAELGSIVLDLGAGATGVAVVAKGRLHHLDTAQLGGEHVTQDLAYGLGTSRSHAERIKVLYASAQACAGDGLQHLLVPPLGGNRLGGHEVRRSRLSEIVRPRLEETFLLVRHRLAERKAIAPLPACRQIVLTGGGSQLEGVADLAAEMFDMPVRLGRPMPVLGMGGVEDSPAAATAVGLLALAASDDGGLGYRTPRPAAMFAGGLARFGQWLRDNFREG